MLITDTNLLVIEPTIFTDAAAVGTVKLTGSGDVSDTDLTAASSDFTAMGITGGDVIVLNNQPLEVIDRQSATVLSVSLPRASSADGMIGPGDSTGQSFSILTFARIVSQVQTSVLTLLGINPLDPPQSIDESVVVSTEPLRTLIALRTIARVLEIASTYDPDSVGLSERANLYSHLAENTQHLAAAGIDLDNDSITDTTRRPGVAVFKRR